MSNVNEEFTYCEVPEFRRPVALVILLALVLVAGGCLVYWWLGQASLVDILLPLAMTLGFGNRAANSLRVLRERVFLDDEGMLVPGDEGPEYIPYREVRVLAPSLPYLYIIGERGRTLLRRNAFATPEAAAACFEVITTQVLQNVEPEALRTQASEVRAAALRPTPVTMCLLAACCLIFLREIATGALQPDGTLELFRMGMFDRELVRKGDWYRLISANYLHGSYQHIVVNMLSLKALATPLEKRFGGPTLLILYLGSAISGTLTCCLTPYPCLGASTAICGLMGALLASHLRGDPPEWRLPRRWFTVNLGILTVISLIPGISWTGHLGGFLGGMLLGWIFCVPRSVWLVQAAALMLSITHLLGLGAAAHAYATRPPLNLLDELRGASTDPGGVNNFSYLLSIDPKATREQLESALKQLEALPDYSTNQSWLDTGATLHYRLGHYEEAVKLESSLSPSPSRRAQLARFIKAYRDHGGRLPPTLRLQRDHLYSPPQAMTVYLLVEDAKSNLQGLEIVPTRGEQDLDLSADLAKWPGNAHFRLGCTGVPRHKVKHNEAWEMTEEIRRLP